MPRSRLGSQRDLLKIESGIFIEFANLLRIEEKANLAGFYMKMYEREGAAPDHDSLL